jgi:hypothetical protein
MFVSLFEDHKVSVRSETVEADATRILVQYHRFPGTNSTVAHASIDGFELAVETSPCVDPRNFREDLGIKYSTERVMEKAKSKLWEIHGAGLLTLMKHYQQKSTVEQFIKDYGHIYNIQKVENATW